MCMTCIGKFTKALVIMPLNKKYCVCESMDIMLEAHQGNAIALRDERKRQWDCKNVEES